MRPSRPSYKDFGIDLVKVDCMVDYEEGLLKSLAVNA